MQHCLFFFPYVHQHNKFRRWHSRYVYVDFWICDAGCDCDYYRVDTCEAVLWVQVWWGVGDLDTEGKGNEWEEKVRGGRGRDEKENETDWVGCVEEAVEGGLKAVKYVFDWKSGYGRSKEWLAYVARNESDMDKRAKGGVFFQAFWH